MIVETFDKDLNLSECYVFNLRTTYHHDLIPLVEYNSEPSIPMPENASPTYGVKNVSHCNYTHLNFDKRLRQYY